MALLQALREHLSTLGPQEGRRFCSSGKEGVNRILQLRGREAKLPPMLVGAHYVGQLHSPGADDKASGVVASLELARRWSADPPRGRSAGGVRSEGVADVGQRCAEVLITDHKAHEKHSACRSRDSRSEERPLSPAEGSVRDRHTAATSERSRLPPQ
jgi:hypothetical protein